MTHPKKPVVLIILDGWGYSESPTYNAIYAARKPVWDQLWGHRPHTLIRASEAAVGLPSGQMGNSEVGHLNLGAGRVVYQEFTRVTLAIKDGSFFANRTLTDAVDAARANDKAIHIMGLLSPGGVHSHEEHMQAMIELAVKRGAKKVYLHAFLDGRDTPPKSAAESIKATEAVFARSGGGRFASVIGRYYAMDRDHRWPRIKAAYDLITTGHGDYSAPNAMAALAAAYERGESDEFVKATAIVPHGSQPVTIQDGDAVIFMNFRSDRARQITRPFIEPAFSAFARAATPHIGAFVSLTEYSEEFASQVAFPAARLSNVFGAYIAGLGMRQLRIAETEKYAHVTFFFNGGEEHPFIGEDRILVNSPNVATYDLKPDMSAVEVTDKLVAAIASETYDTIICNYANPDMVGHTGNMAATIQAIEALDACLGRVLEAVRKVGGEALITADHGNAEMMRSEDDTQAHTAHTINTVPFIYVGERAVRMANTGALCDVAPTMLYLMGLAIPREMNGRPLLELT
ncbi:MAG: 2,3-bisphosphoglycerate-independent phosphoglycerate mutase [Pseudomonadota bacterium]